MLIAFREDPDLVRRTAEERKYVAPVLIDKSGDVTGRVYGVFGPPTVSSARVAKTTAVRPITMPRP